MTPRTIRWKLASRLAVAVLAIPLAAGCQDGREASVDDKPAAVQEHSTSADAQGDRSIAPTPTDPTPGPPSPPSKPKRPVDGWVIFRSAFDEDTDAEVDSAWTGGNRLEVRTRNVHRVTLDLTRLPAAASQRGPWNLQIDKQGIAITGARGRVLDLVRSQNGDWSVDRDRDRRR